MPGSLSHIVGGQLAPLATVTKALSRLAYRCSGNLLIARPSVLFRAALSGRWRCRVNQLLSQLPPHFRWHWWRRPIFSALGHPIPHLLLVRLHCARHGWLLAWNCKIGGYSLQSPGVINPVRSPNLTGRFADHPLSQLWWPVLPFRLYSAPETMICWLCRCIEGRCASVCAFTTRLMTGTIAG